MYLTELTVEKRSGYVGKPVKRVEDQRLIQGGGRYTNDLVMRGMLYAKVLRSPYAHATIKKIDVSRSVRLAGVQAVITGSDIANFTNQYYNILDNNVREPLLPLARQKVYFAGQEVAAVAAETPGIAEDALELIDVEYEPLRAVVDPEEAAEPHSQIVRDDIEGLSSNIAFEYKLRAGDAVQAFSKARYVIEEKFDTGRQHLAPLEPSAAIAFFDAPRGRLTLWANTQTPFGLRKNLSQLFQIPENKIRVIVPDMGGGFGARGSSYSHFIVPGILSRVTGRPIQLVLDRREDLLASGHRNACLAKLALALTEEGKILGIRGRVLWDTGAWHGIGSGSLSKGLLQMAGPYKIENVELDGLCVYTNKSLTDASRGFGQPQTVFIRERLLDMAAKKIGVDPLEIRLLNVIKPDEVPYRSSTGPLFDSPHFARCLTLAADAVGWQRIRRDGKQSNLGVGIALYQKNNSGYQSHGYGAKYLADYDTVRVEVAPDCSVTIFTGALAHGQGHETFMAQIAADELGLALDKVAVVYGDTDRVPYGMGTFGSRTAVISGGALHLACDRVVEKMKKIAAFNLGGQDQTTGIEFANGRFFRKGKPDRSLSFSEIVLLSYTRPDKLPQGIEPTLHASATYDPPGKVPFDEQGRSQVSSSYDIGAFAVVVKVDPETGDLKILDQALAYDCGKLINPLIVEGQHHGGIAHGLGMAAYESLRWSDEGQPLNNTFSDLMMPTALEVPPITKLIKLESFPIYHKWGYRGAGESGTIAVPAAIANAASVAVGGELNELPISPEMLLKSIASKKGE